MKNIRKIMSLCLCLVLALSVTVPAFAAVNDAPANADAAINKFDDVNAGDYFATPVAWAVENGVTAGTSNTTFSPYENCTQWQAYALIYRAAGSPKVTNLNDDQKTHLAGLTGEEYDAVAWYISFDNFFGYTDVSEGTVRLSASYYIDEAKALPVTRNEFLGILNQLSASTKNYDDVDTYYEITKQFADLYPGGETPESIKMVGKTDAFTVSQDFRWKACANAAWAVDNGIASGTSATTFSPNATCTRAQIVTFLYRYFIEQGLTFNV